MNMKVLIASLGLVVGMLPLSAQQTEEMLLDDFNPADVGMLEPSAHSTGAGLHAAAVFPEQQLSKAVNGRLGGQFGAHASVDLSRGNELRPRIDYIAFTGGSVSLTTLSTTTSIHAISVGMDYLDYLNVRTRGFYLMSGLAMDWWSTHYRFQPSETKTSPTFSIGMGDRFNQHMSLEFAYDFGEFRNTLGSAGGFKVGFYYDF